MLKFVFGLSVLALMASPAIAQQPKQDDTTKNANEKLICKREEAVGSRLAAKRVCLTAKEWDEIAAANREHTEDIQRGAGGRSSNCLGTRHVETCLWFECSDARYVAAGSAAACR